MKKIYTQPTFSQYELICSDVILTSVVSNGTLDGNDGQTFEDIF